MSFFKNFPTTVYDFGDDKMEVPNILKSFKITTDFIENDELFLLYNIRDGETPEMIADRMYDDSELAWVLLIVNNVFDVNTQWPMSYATLERYIDAHYGFGKRNTIHHYTDLHGVIVEADHPTYDRIPVTVYDNESILNDEKRKIRVLKSEYLDSLRSAVWGAFN